MLKNRYNLIILVLGLVFVLGGCLKKVENKPVVIEKKQNNNIQETVKKDELVIDTGSHSPQINYDNKESVDEIFIAPAEEWSKETWPSQDVVEKFDYTGWKTYVNPNGYSVMYPPSWGFFERDGFGFANIEFDPLGESGLYNYLVIDVSVELDSIEEANKALKFQESLKFIDPSDKIIQKDLFFLQHKAYYYKYEEPYITKQKNLELIELSRRAIILVHNNKIYDIGIKKDKISEYRMLETQQIIASFKFTD